MVVILILKEIFACVSNSKVSVFRSSSSSSIATEVIMVKIAEEKDSRMKFLKLK